MHPNGPNEEWYTDAIIWQIGQGVLNELRACSSSAQG